MSQQIRPLTALKKAQPEPPGAVKEHKEAIAVLLEMHRNRLKSDKNWYVKNYELLDNYSHYLKELLDSQGIAYLSQDEFLQAEEQDFRAYSQELDQARKSYQEALSKGLKQPALPRSME